MPQCIAAVFTAALRLLRALISPPKGRHSARHPGARRRRSTRVRRYAPMAPAAPTPLPAHPVAQNPWLEPQFGAGGTNAEHVEPRRKLRPPSTGIDADDIALVRPYYRAHEAEADRAQDRAAARLRAWGADLDFGFGPAPDGTPTYTLDGHPAPEPGPEPDPEPEPDPPAAADTFRVPAPRPPFPRLPARMDDLPHLSRIRARQQQRRHDALAGVGA